MGKIKVTFLGTGTSQGVPVIGCDCNVCQSDDPRDKRSRASLFLQTESASWVIDTGPDFRMQCLRAGINHLDAVVYTHAHTDHVVGFDDLRRFCTLKDGSMPLYGSPETLAQIASMFVFAFNGQNRFPGYVIPEPMPVTESFNLGGLKISPLPVPHGRMTVYGYLHEAGGKKLLAYISDCKTVPEEVLARITGVDTLVIDALRHESHPTHLSIPESIEVARATGARQTLFTHLCDRVMHAEADSNLPQGISIAYDGMVLELQ